MWKGASADDSTLDLDQFRDTLKIDIQRCDELEMEFDLVGVDASIANALRRILIAEVPTMAIENVYVFQNTSVIQDEVLAHRLGLIPIKADPGKFGWQNGMFMHCSPVFGTNVYVVGPDGKRLATDYDTLAFKLEVRCEKIHQSERDESDPNKLFKHANGILYLCACG